MFLILSLGMLYNSSDQKLVLAKLTCINNRNSVQRRYTLLPRVTLCPSGRKEHSPSDSTATVFACIIFSPVLTRTVQYS